MFEKMKYNRVQRNYCTLCACSKFNIRHNQIDVIGVVVVLFFCWLVFCWRDCIASGRRNLFIVCGSG